MKYLHIIDGNSMGYAHHMGTVLTIGEQQTQAIYGFVRMMHQLYSRWPQRDNLVLWDGDVSKSWRRALYPEYKANRDQTPSQKERRAAYKSQVGHIRTALSSLGIPQSVDHNCEADDLAATYVRHLSTKGIALELITADQDWLQLIGPNVSWRDPIHDKTCDESTFSFVTGFDTPDQFIQAKALAGDNSDNIKGVGGIGKVNAAKLLETYTSVEKFQESAAGLCEVERAKLPKAWRAFIDDEAAQRRYTRNLQLVALKPTFKGSLDTGKYDPEKFKRLCEDFGFQSILDNFEDWIYPFERKANK